MEHKYFRYIHPLLLQNGDLIVKDHESPLMRIDACANLKWRLDKDFYHHSTELDATGAIWVPARIEPSEVPGTSAEFLDEALFQVSLDGEILFKKSLTNILIDNGFERDLFAQGNYNRDPVHLNDIQPVLEDGPFWKRGDLFLSIRHLSMIALYRPSEDRIVWQQQGPWAAQHDVDILDENRIAIYNNNSYRYRRRGEPVVKGLNEIVVYDFRTDQVSRPWQPFFEKYNIKAFAEGLFELLPGGYLLVDEATSARLLLLDRSGKMVAEFVNRASDGKVYHLGWSRIVSRELGDKVLASVRTKDCD